MATDLLTAAQVGQMLDLDTSTVYRMAGDGRLAAVRVGRQWRFPADRLARALESGIPATAVARAPYVPATGPAAGQVPDVMSTVMDLVARALGVTMLVTDMQGRPVTDVANPCPWFRDHAGDPQVVAECLDDWRALASELDLTPHFRMGRHGFLCARTFLRSGTELTGMVLVGGVAPDVADAGDDGLHHLDAAARQHVLDMLPRVAAALSTLSPNRSPS